MVESREIFQAGYVVADIDAAMHNWMRVAQIGPFFISRDVRANLVYRGQPGEILADVAYCQAGPIMIELVQPKSAGPNHYRDTVPEGTDAYHHQAYWTDDFDGELERFKAMGVEVAVQGQSGSVRFAYFDTSHLVGCMTEILERDPEFVAFFEKIAAAAQDWDGSDPVRPI